MNQGRKVIALCAVLAVAGTLAALPALAARRAETGTSTSASAKAKQSVRQFTGVVTAMDKTSITVEKGGSKPRTMVFTRTAAMRTVGDVGKDARVTVYYREDGKETQAVRVVVKPDRSGER
jgi:hypothetical protein